jgi:hypothetical protein
VPANHTPPEDPPEDPPDDEDDVAENPEDRILLERAYRAMAARQPLTPLERANLPPWWLPGPRPRQRPGLATRRKREPEGPWWLRG